MTPYWTALLATIGGIFTLAFKYPAAFNKIWWVACSVASFVLIAGGAFALGMLYGRTGDRTIDEIWPTAAWTYNALILSVFAARWLAPRNED